MFKKDNDCGFAVQITTGRALYQFQSGNLQGRMLSEIDYQQLLQIQKNTPVVVLRGGRNTWWMFRSSFYCEDEGYSAEKVEWELISPLEREKRLEEVEKSLSGETPPTGVGGFSVVFPR